MEEPEVRVIWPDGAASGWMPATLGDVTTVTRGIVQN